VRPHIYSGIRLNFTETEPIKGNPPPPYLKTNEGSAIFAIDNVYYSSGIKQEPEEGNENSGSDLKYGNEA